MDEILIEEKKYISSKQAAKVTGYAKDYIGQLCREGRVPARLVGRSWYVLETAIKDHRFGATDDKKEEGLLKKHSAPIVSHVWESPRYEASSDELLPSINRLNVESEAINHIEDSWKAWFEHVANTETNVPVGKKTETVENEYMDEKKPAEEPEEPEEIEENKKDEKVVNIPIHTVYRTTKNPLPLKEKHKLNNRVIMRIVQTGGVLLAVITAAVAIIGSGYLDAHIVTSDYMISSSQFKMIAGVELYNR